MSRLNLSAWAIRHPQMVLFIMALVVIFGVQSYTKLGRDELPGFTFKTMVVRTLWPGATAAEVTQELTERIEKKLQELPGLDFLNSVSRPGESLIFVQIKEQVRGRDVSDTWYQVRKMLGDIRPTLPSGAQGPFANDEFGDVDVLLYALTGDGYDMATLRQTADNIGRELKLLGGVKKIEFIGVQAEKIYVNLSPARLAAMGLAANQVFDAVKKQNTSVEGGFIETQTHRIHLNVSGPFDTVERIRNTELAANGKHFRLGDIADVKRGFADPPSPSMHFDSKPAIGLGVVMEPGGNVLELGSAVDKTIQRLRASLPAGIEIHTAADQPEVASSAVKGFLDSLAEAVAIILAVSFFSLGLRSGTIVAITVPVVLAGTFIVMHLLHIDLHRVSLGSLVISLGLLVDDAIIVVEMMVVKMEHGWDRFKAATYAYSSTAFPMLTGTLIAVVGFSPVGFSASMTGEFMVSNFQVTAIALLISWVIAVVFTPFLGYHLLNREKLVAQAAKHGDNIYGTPFYRRLRALVVGCMRHRWWVILATIAAFLLAVLAFRTVVQQQYFSYADRYEIVIDIELPLGASSRAIRAEAEKVEHLLSEDSTIRRYTTYIGRGAPRFYLPMDQKLESENFAQIVALTHDGKEREALKARLEAKIADASGEFSSARIRPTRLNGGPPITYPVQFRVSGTDLAILRSISAEVAKVMRSDPALRNIHFDWNEKIKSLTVELNQPRLRELGLSSEEVGQSLQGWLNGAPITQYREGDQLIDIVWRAAPGVQLKLDQLPELDIAVSGGRHVPLSQVARLVPVIEEGAIWRRNRLPTITINADLADESLQGQTLSSRIWPQLASIRAALPVGYEIEMGGAIEVASNGEKPIMALVPIMGVIVAFLLMMQLQSISRTALVLLTAPLAMIGVPIGLILFNMPFGFVATLGMIALMGMIMRNSVILVDQIEQDERAGKDRWNAIIDSTVRRFRPIALTAAAAVLAMIPLSRQPFWGTFAVTVMSGLIVATVLTCLFLPALYAAWFRVREQRDSA